VGEQKAPRITTSHGSFQRSQTSRGEPVQSRASGRQVWTAHFSAMMGIYRAAKPSDAA